MIDLSTISTDDLRAELARRETKDAEAVEWPAVNRDYYAIPSETLECAEPGQWFIVHKRYWHYHHCCDDNRLPDDLRFPAKLFEVSESTFEYEGEQTEAITALVAAGFTVFPKAWWDGRVSHAIRFSGREGVYHVLCFHVDTPRIEADLMAWIASRPNVYASREQLDEALGQWATQHGYAAGPFDHYDGGCYAYVMDAELFKSLPPLPEPSDDD